MKVFIGLVIGIALCYFALSFLNKHPNVKREIDKMADESGKSARKNADEIWDREAESIRKRIADSAASKKSSKGEK